MLIVLSIVLGLIFLQADDNFAGVQDRCVEHVSGWSKICVFYVLYLPGLVPCSLL